MQMHIPLIPLHPPSVSVFPLALLATPLSHFSILQLASHTLVFCQICSMILRGYHHARVVCLSPSAVQSSARFLAANLQQSTMHVSESALLIQGRKSGSTNQVSGVGAGFCSRTVACGSRSCTRQGRIKSTLAYPIQLPLCHPLPIV